MSSKKKKSLADWREIFDITIVGRLSRTDIHDRLINNPVNQETWNSINKEKIFMNGLCDYAAGVLGDLLDAKDFGTEDSGDPIYALIESRHLGPLHAVIILEWSGHPDRVIWADFYGVWQGFNEFAAETNNEFKKSLFFNRCSRNEVENAFSFLTRLTPSISDATLLAIFSKYFAPEYVQQYIKPTEIIDNTTNFSMI